MLFLTLALRTLSFENFLSLMYMLMQLRPVHTLGFCWYVLLYFTNIFQFRKKSFCEFSILVVDSSVLVPIQKITLTCYVVSFAS